MMKKILHPLLIGSALVSWLAAETHTWTSPDGAKTFEAEITKFENDTITVRYPNGKEISFGTDKVSADDTSFAKEWAEKQANEAAEEEAKSNQPFANKLKEIKFQQLVDGKMKKAEFSDPAELYLRGQIQRKHRRKQQG